MLGIRRAQLRPASFRGVRFWVEEAGHESGRRWADHEYPGRDEPYAEDLGRRQRVWRFTAYIIDENYHTHRDRLVAACEAAGPGELVHPTIGAVEVACRSIRVTEARERGRHAAYELEFAEAGQLQEPSDATDRNLACEFAADDLGAIAPQDFAANYDVAGGGAWLTSSAAADITDLSDMLYRLRLPASGYPQGPLEVALANLSDNADALAVSPGALTGAVDDSFAAFTNAGDAFPVVGAMLMFVDTWQTGTAAPYGAGFALLSAPIVGYQSPWRYRGGDSPLLRRAANRAAFQRFVRELALREIGYAVTGLDLDNYDAAIEMLDKIAAAFVTVEQATADAGEDDVFAALASLRAAITRMVSARAADLNPLVTYRTLAAANSLGLAWRLYQNSGRDIEIVARTGMGAGGARNPGFLPLSGRVLSA